MASDRKRIILEHGSGGALSRELTEQLIYSLFQSPQYAELGDATAFSSDHSLFLTTDTYVVDPPFFPGGDIGTLAVCGTCNDLAVSGAQPQFLSLGLVLEEGFFIDDLERILNSIQELCAATGVRIITGDTKVVPTGKGGGIFINTTGVGRAVFSGTLSPRRIKDGDVVIVSAAVGRHGLAILAARESLPVSVGLQSDCAYLYPLCAGLFSLGPDLRFMRDATRGGLAAVLNEAVSGLQVGIEVSENRIPVPRGVTAAADLLGLNPLEIANEGVIVTVVAASAGDKAVNLLQGHPLGREAAVIGHITATYPGKVVLETIVGGKRILDLPRGLLLPRIC